MDLRRWIQTSQPGELSSNDAPRPWPTAARFPSRPRAGRPPTWNSTVSDPSHLHEKQHFCFFPFPTAVASPLSSATTTTNNRGAGTGTGTHQPEESRRVPSHKPIGSALGWVVRRRPSRPSSKKTCAIRYGPRPPLLNHHHHRRRRHPYLIPRALLLASSLAAGTQTLAIMCPSSPPSGSGKNM